MRCEILLRATVQRDEANQRKKTLLHYMTRTQATFVHYKKSSERLTDVMAGRTHAAAVTYATGMPGAKAGKFRTIGVTTDKRLSVAPDLPTIAEQGVKGFDYSSWTGVLAPAGVPAPIVAKLNGIWAQAIKIPTWRRKSAVATVPS